MESNILKIINIKYFANIQLEYFTNIQIQGGHSIEKPGEPGESRSLIKFKINALYNRKT